MSQKNVKMEEKKSEVNLLLRFVGKHVVVRSHMSGVWFGMLDAVDARSAILLSEARRAWSWEGAGSCSGLATHGPTGGKITAPAVVVIPESVEIITCSDDAVAQWKSIPVWSGRK